MTATPKAVDMDVPAEQRSGPKPRLVDIDKGLFAFNLVKRYGRRPLLRGVSLSLQRGEIVGLLGPNGAGKTTCFYLIVGLSAPNEGTVILDGQDVTQLPLHRRARMGIGYLPQESSIFRGLSVEKNLACILELVDPARSKRDAALDALLEEFGIAHLRKSSAAALSGGERRRLEIARALASNPQFIFLDEPFAGIDPIAVDDIRSLVAHLKDRGIGVLITDHNVHDTLDVIDRAYIIHDGLVLTEGTAREVVENADVRRHYLGERFQYKG